MSLGLMADLVLERVAGDSSMPVNRWAVPRRQGAVRRGTRVIGRKLDCLNPNLQKVQIPARRNDA